jgi:hypothetical protein
MTAERWQSLHELKKHDLVVITRKEPLGLRTETFRVIGKAGTPDEQLEIFGERVDMPSGLVTSISRTIVEGPPNMLVRHLVPSTVTEAGNEWWKQIRS